MFGLVVTSTAEINSDMFQSLSRDSVCLDDAYIEGMLDVDGFQSLSRDSVCLDMKIDDLFPRKYAVSIPESGFCLFGQDWTCQGHGNG